MIHRRPWGHRVLRDEQGAQMVEYVLITPLVVVFLAALLGQLALAAVGLITCESAARDAAVAAARGNDPLLAARKAAPDWNVAVSEPEDVRSGDYHGVRVSVTLTVPALPVRMFAGRSLPITRTATMPTEKG